MNIYNILFINFLFQKNGYVIKNFQLKNSDYERQNNVYVTSFDSTPFFCGNDNNYYTFITKIKK